MSELKEILKEIREIRQAQKNFERILLENNEKCEKLLNENKQLKTTVKNLMNENEKTREIVKKLNNDLVFI